MGFRAGRSKGAWVGVGGSGGGGGGGTLDVVDQYYGESYLSENSASVTLTLIDTWYPLNITWTAGALNGFSHTVAGGILKPTNDGNYEVVFSASFEDGINQDIEHAIFINGVQAVKMVSRRTIGTGGAFGAFSLSGILENLQAGDEIQVYARNISSGGKAVTVKHANLSISTIGGTSFNSNIATYRDSFDTEKAFWENTQAITSLDWQIDTANSRLEGIAQNNADDWFREGIEGDIDYQIKFDRNTATSVGFSLRSDKTGTLIAECKKTATDLWGRFTGEANQDVVLSADELWLRIKRFKDIITMYYKIDDADSWIAYATFTDADIGSDVTAYINSGNGSYIYEVILYDNMYGENLRGISSKIIPLTDGANISIPTERGNTFSVTLGGNRTIDNPVNNLQGQKIILRIKQDGTGSRTITWGGKYRFSLDLPEPILSTSGGAIDYFGFIYNEDADKWDLIAETKGF